MAESIESVPGHPSPKTVGIVYGGRQITTTRGRAGIALVVLLAAISGGGAGHLHKDPLTLTYEERKAAFEAFMALQQKANDLQRQYSDADAKVETFDSVKRERDLQKEKGKLLTPIQKAKADADKPFDDQMVPINKAMQDSQARIDADPQVKTQKAVQEKLLKEIEPERDFWTSTQNSLRNARGLPLDCNLDTQGAAGIGSFDRWVHLAPDKDGKPVACAAGK